MPVNQEGPKMAADVNDFGEVAKNRSDSAGSQEDLCCI
jgi:hypothetical protein